MPPRSPAPETWDEAVRRATDATAADRPGGMDEQCWDDVAMRSIVATVLYALHLRERQPVDAIGWPSVLWQLRDDVRVAELVTTVLPRAGHDLARTAAPGDPVTECWRWLTRTWDPVPDAPEPRWGSMSRGIGKGLPDPALVMNSSGVSRPSLSHQSGGFGLDRVRWPASLGVSEVADKRYSFETVWRRAA
ncbi:hypothetical protein [Streptomyces sp. NPDC097610]|uniref:hypothetical protein n=1 Tax=Streptomyces sp. NPDC097610 TaxID=3157227 RepID=UPI003321FFC1